MSRDDNDIAKPPEPARPPDGVARALSQKAARLEAMLDGVEHGLCMFDADGRIVEFNKHYIKLMALPADGLVGMSLLDLFRLRKAAGKFDHDPDEVFALVRSYSSAGRVMTHAVDSCDGRALRVTNKPLADGGWVATIEDMTELRSFQLERERQRQFLNNVLDNVPVMVVVKDPLERRFLHANRAAESFWGFSRDEAIGKTLRELLPMANAEVVDRLDAESIATGTGFTQEAHDSIAPLRGRAVTTK